MFFDGWTDLARVAIGSTLATVLLNNSVALAEGVVAMGMLIAMQFLITWTCVRSPRFESLVKSEPALLLHKGRFLDCALRSQRVMRDEVLSALRSQGENDVASVAAVVLETDGTMSVLTKAFEAADQPTMPGARE